MLYWRGWEISLPRKAWRENRKMNVIRSNFSGESLTAPTGKKPEGKGYYLKATNIRTTH